jgi:hypothetical protein
VILKLVASEGYDPSENLTAFLAFFKGITANAVRIRPAPADHAQAAPYMKCKSSRISLFTKSRT